MPLFDVPGWSLSEPPVIETVNSTSKKRKRPPGDTQKLYSAEFNIEKLVKRLKSTSSIDNLGNGEKKPKNPGSRKLDKDKSARHESLSNQKKSPKPQGAGKDSSREKKGKGKHAPELSSSQARVPAKKSVDASTSGMTSLQQGMKQSLSGARFRLINESLYKSDSRKAHQMMKEDPSVYEDYHTGFRHQVQLWPTNPVEYYIEILSTYPERTVIADLGCGDAAIARALVPRGITVLSFDLVSDGIFVVETDICSKIPLPGSEGTNYAKSDGEGHVVDVVVCALSLMGTNWPNCLREAWRILKPE
ncbi:hypothetical protein H0H81_006109 [Sphagnurus paluster]|uniref:Ribosomal RNA-processing protein 8 n=1 Tax=Sphagnurus paluster TaxID=117069 RepID=A0A9P7FTY4_9AGAR|nr:hypothetical protein H0H81_006109 [Sphagnurus paluster]